MAAGQVSRRRDMNENLIKEITKKLETKSTDELIEIWKEDKQEEWSPEAFEAARRILVSRGENVPGRAEEKAARWPARQGAEFCAREFLSTVMKGAMFGFAGTVVLLVIGFLASKDESPLVPENIFHLITYVLLVVVLGGFYSGGMYVRHVQEKGANSGLIDGMALGLLIGGIYFPLQIFLINPVLSRALHISYENKTTPIQAVVVGCIAVLVFMGLGYFGQKDEK